MIEEIMIVLGIYLMYEGIKDYGKWKKKNKKDREFLFEKTGIKVSGS